MKGVYRKVRMSVCILLCTFMIFGTIFHIQYLPVEAAVKKTLKLSQVYSLALANSEEYRKLRSERNLKNVEYETAVKAVKLKKENMESFRWSPLLSFKFPESPALAQEFEFTYKPYMVRAQISAVEHALSNVKYNVIEEVSLLYAKLYEQQQTIAVNEKKLALLEKERRRKQAKVYLGKAAVSDVEKMQKSIETLTATIASDHSTYLSNQLKLGDLIHLDISSNYTFANPFVQANLTRGDLDALIKRTLSYHQGLFEKKLETNTKMVAMDTNYNLMRNQYGGKASPLETYINQAKSGEKINGDALKSTYQQVITNVDQPWNGSYRILFISIPKEWLKGSIAGVRYIEDDPYVLYTSILEYQEAYEDQLSTEKELKQEITDSYSGLVAMKNAYEAAKQNTKDSLREMEQGMQQNLQGEVTLEELNELQEAYNTAELDELRSLSDYAQVLYSFDKLTFGGVTELMEQADADMRAALGGKTTISANMVDGASYYIKSIVEDNSFELGIYIPEDFKIEVTAYELWVDNTQVGKRTTKDESIIHLSLTTFQTKKVFVRLYNGEEFIDDCMIDPAAFTGSLNVTGGYQVEKSVSDIVGTFTYTTNESNRITTIQLKMNADELARYYVVKNAAGVDLLSGKKISVSEGFSYLNLAAVSMNELQLIFYDKLGNEMYTAHLDRSKQTMKKDKTE